MTAPTPDAFSRHEALHMANFLAGAVGLELVDHPAVMANPQWLALAERACEALGELYQAIGQEAADGHTQQVVPKLDPSQKRFHERMVEWRRSLQLGARLIAEATTEAELAFLDHLADDLKREDDAE